MLNNLKEIFIVCVSTSGFALVDRECIDPCAKPTARNHLIVTSDVACPRAGVGVIITRLSSPRRHHTHASKSCLYF